MRRCTVLLATLVAMSGLGASAAFAGEIKGPPYQGAPVSGGIGNPTNTTAAEAHSHSLCSFSGLNDYDSDPPGQTDRQTQTPKDGPFPGSPGLGFEAAPGVWISCRGNGTHK